MLLNSSSSTSSILSALLEFLVSSHSSSPGLISSHLIFFPPPAAPPSSLSTSHTIMKPGTSLRLKALRPSHGPSSMLLRRQPIAGRVRAMSTVVDYVGRPSHPPPPPAHENIEQQRRERAKRILREATQVAQPRHDWTKEEIAAIYYQPLMELTYQSVSTLSSSFLSFLPARKY